MHSPVRSLVTAFAAALFLFQAGNATATEIKILSAVGMKAALDELGPKFERASGHTLRIEFANLGAVLKRVEDGVTADVVILPRQGIDRLVGQGTARSTSVTVLARAGIGLAVRKGAPKPDIATPQALKHALLEAKSVTYLDPAGGGTSGVHFVKVLDRLCRGDHDGRQGRRHSRASADRFSPHCRSRGSDQGEGYGTGLTRAGTRRATCPDGLPPFAGRREYRRS